MYEKFSRLYGWTPNQIRDLTIEDERAYKAIIAGQEATGK